MSIRCEYAVLVPHPTLSIRVSATATEMPTIFAKGYRQILQYLNEIKVEPTGEQFAIYYTLDLRHLDVEFGYPVSKVLPDKGNIKSSETPSGKAVKCLHIGAYNQVQSSYRALTEWIKDNGYEAEGIAYEKYLSNLISTSPEHLKTEVYQLIMSVK